MTINPRPSLKQLLKSNNTEFIMEAHSALSAKIVEEAGFNGIWASGLSMSTLHGTRDRNELSWTQILENVEHMSDVTNIPILVDGDSGYGDFNNFSRFVSKLCQRGISGVCIEDKAFPKVNSFSNSYCPLADKNEFVGKLKAGLDIRSDNAFSIIARVEALIVGKSMSEALDRAHCYAETGVDGILIHSKSSQANEVLEFASKWDGNCPLIVVPTKYYNTPTDKFRNANISMVIWANHCLRASITAMQNIAKTIHQQQSIQEVERQISSIDEVFRLNGETKMKEMETKYLRHG